MTFPASALSLNSATVRRLDLAAAADLCVRHDIGGIGVWREQLEGAGGPERAAALVRGAGLHVSSLCRGGFFTGPDRRAVLDDNRAAIAEAHALGADVLVLVCGGLPAGGRDLERARERIVEAIGELAGEARDAGVRLGVEALHPMFCADRCAVSSLGQALEIAERFDADAVGIVVDAYHVWWDAAVLDVVARAGERIASYQVSDWILPLTQDVLLNRGHVGDGCIDFGPLGRAVRDAGYAGMVEVEIFNEEIWDAPADATAATVVQRFAAHVAQPCRASDIR